jgi:hypothetical protein
VATHFDDSAGESATSRTSRMKGGNYDTNGFDLDKNKIIKPIFDTMAKEGCKVLEAYRDDLSEVFYSRYEVMRPQRRSVDHHP